MVLFTSGVWLGALLSLISVVRSQNASIVHSGDADPTEDFCFLNRPMMAQKDGMLYIAGGYMGYPTRHTDHNGPNRVLRSLNVSKSFRISDGSASFINVEMVPDNLPSVQDAAFFPTESGFDLTFGAWYPYNRTIYGRRDAPIMNKKWRYEIATGRWTNTDITLRNWFRSNTSRRVSSPMTAWVPSLKKGFLFGGYFSSVNETSLRVTVREEHPGLITYEQATNTWTNQSTSFGGISEGGLVHITTATDEVLIQLGGRTQWYTRMMEFSDIRIYSTNQSKWYTQRLPAGAPAPAPRYSFCTALKSAPDGSSHQIYIMGGAEASSPVETKGGPTVDSVWALSIPSFEWALLEVRSMTSAMNPRARISPKCQAIGRHYIFLYGGSNTLSSSATVTCDKKANSAFLFDVNTLTWADKFEPNEGTYEIPQKVLELIGGNKTGGSTKKAPPNGWSDPDLETVMALKSTPSPPPRSPSITSSPKPNVGAIAGGTIGGIAAVLLVLLGVVILRLRREKKRSQIPPNHTATPQALFGTLKEGDNPMEFMEPNQTNSSGAFVGQFPSAGWGGGWTPGTERVT
ncbi:hypothetical protein HOY80DRAFT_1094215 [Tuber brumale]|nr:hypothetical protein HOY80DRAFT_1094215 [Tuber brumale]